MPGQRDTNSKLFDSSLYLLLLLVIAAVIAYANSFSGPFIFDDEDSITKNPYIRQLRPLSNILKAPVNSTVAGRPIVSLTLAINYALGAYDAWGYHVVNLLIHVLAGVVLYGIVRRTLLTKKLKDRFGRHASLLAWSVTLIWLVHPIQTESVTYIIQRTESLLGLFYLLTLYAAIRARHSANKLWWSVLSVACCTVGMATKEAMVTAPVVVLLYERTFFFGSFRAALRHRWRFYLSLAASWAVLAVLMWSGPRAATTGFSLGVPALDYVLNQGPIIVHYLRLSFWPTNLCLDYGWPANRDLLELLPSVLAISAMLAVTVTGLVRNLSWSFPAVWIFAILAPTSSFVPVADLAFEHRMYLPLAGLITLVILAGYRLLGRVAKATGASLPFYRTGVIAVLIVAAGFGVRTVVRNNDYRSSISIWQATVKTARRNPRVYLNMGKTLHLAGRIDEAIEQYVAAIELNPDYAEVHVNLGAAQKRRGKLDIAIEHYRKALQIKPDMAEAYYNLANVLEMQGKLDEAIAHHTKALKLNRHLHQAHYALADILSSQGRYGPAIQHYRSALNAKPQEAYLHSELAAALAEQGHIDEAIAHYKQALKIKPDLVEARTGLDELLDRGRPAGNNY